MRNKFNFIVCLISFFLVGISSKQVFAQGNMKNLLNASKLVEAGRYFEARQVLVKMPVEWQDYYLYLMLRYKTELNLKNYQVAIVMLERIYYKSGDKFILEDLNALKNKVNYKKQVDKAAQNCLMCFGTGKVEKSFVCNVCNGNNGSCTNCGGKGRVKKIVTCNHN